MSNAGAGAGAGFAFEALEIAFKSWAFIASELVAPAFGRMLGGGTATGGALIAGGAAGFGGSTEAPPPFFNSSRTLLPVLRAWPPMT